jgi:hypothetical protein
VIVPSGEPVGVGLTLAVNATTWPTIEGFGLVARVVVVGVAVTVSFTGDDVEAVKLEFPE